MLPKATSILVINPKTGHVLGATRRGTIDKWGFIGGKQDPGETIEECAAREFQEETGFCISGGLDEIFDRDCEAGIDGKSFHVHVFMLAKAADVEDVVEKFKTPRIVEEDERGGILVGFVPYMEMIKGPFGKFNEDLLNAILTSISFGRD